MDEDSDFYIDIDIDHPFVKIAQHEKVVSGQILTAEPFIHATAGTQDWYVEVEDAYNLVQSPVWTFAVE